MPPNKTQDLEFAIRLIINDGNPVTINNMERRLITTYPSLGSEDRRWIGVALNRMCTQNQIRYVGCSREHNHNDACQIVSTVRHA